LLLEYRTNAHYFRSIRKGGYGTYVGIIERAGNSFIENVVFAPVLNVSKRRECRYLIKWKSNVLPILMSVGLNSRFVKLAEFS